MKADAKAILDGPQSIYMLPPWVTSVQGQDTETVAFASGASLAMLDMVLRDPSDTLLGALLRDRLALDAAVACLKLENRNESLFDIRDAVCLARAGDALGPAGDMFVAWRKLARINPIQSGWKDRMVKLLPDPVAEAMPEFDSLVGSPVAQTAQMLAAHLSRKDIRAILSGESDPVFCVHRAMVGACDAAIRRAADLSRRAEKLRAIALKLRAKGSDEALALFLSHDAVSPSGMLSPTIKGTTVAMTDRAARRLCDRLVELCVVREVTGRPTFRLYGV